MGFATEEKTARRYATVYGTFGGPGRARPLPEDVAETPVPTIVDCVPEPPKDRVLQMVEQGRKEWLELVLRPGARLPSASGLIATS